MSKPLNIGMIGYGFMGRAHSNAYRPMGWEDTVTAVTPCWVTPVDIQVDGEAFAAGGVLSHNSAIKGMEYAASGVPFVARDIDEYAWFGAGLLARRPREWRDALTSLLDPAARADVADAAYERVTREDFRVRWTDWESLYASLRN